MDIGTAGKLFKKTIDGEQVDALERIGMRWNRFDEKWEFVFSYAARYVEEHGDIKAVPDDYRADGFKLLQWIRTQRTRYKSGKLAPDRIARLEGIGIIWTLQEAAWECGYIHARAYAECYGDL